MKFAVGKKYRTRGGKTLEFISRTKHGFPVFKSKCGTRVTLYPDGRFYASAESLYDVVEEVPDEVSPEHDCSEEVHAAVLEETLRCIKAIVNSSRASNFEKVLAVDIILK